VNYSSLWVLLDQASEFSKAWNSIVGLIVALGVLAPQSSCD